MKFPYTFNVARSIDTGEEIVILRPEVTVRVFGPAGTSEVIALVGTGSDNSILRISIARNLGIPILTDDNH